LNELARSSEYAERIERTKDTSILGMSSASQQIGDICSLYRTSIRDVVIFPQTNDEECRAYRKKQMRRRSMAESPRPEHALDKKDSLWEEARSFQNIVEYMNEGLGVIDALGNFVYVNKRFAEMLEYTVDEMVEKKITTFMDDANKRIVEDNIGRRKKGESSQYELEWLSKRGYRVPTIVSGAPILDSEGRHSGSFAVITDISHRRRAEKALQDNERFLSSVFASIQDGISVLATDLTIMRVNTTMEKWYSHAMPLVGTKCFAAYHGRSSPCDKCPTKRALETGQPAYEPVPLTGPGGAFRGWLDLYSFPLYDYQTGKLTGVIEYVRDVTSQRAAEEGFRSSKELLEKTFQSQRDSIFIITAEMMPKILDCNRSTAGMFGYSHDEMVGKPFRMLLTDDYSARVLGLKIAETLDEQGFTQISDMPMRRKDGSSFNAEYSAGSLKNEKSEVIGYVTVIRDITEQKRAEAVLRAQRDLGVELSADVEHNETMRILVETAMEISGMDCGALYIVNKDTLSLDLVFQKGLSPEFVEPVSHFEPHTPPARFVMQGVPVYTKYPDSSHPVDKAVAREGLKAFASIPLRHEGLIVAALNLASHTQDSVPDRAREALESIAAQIAGVIAHVEADQSLRQSETRLRGILSALHETMVIVFGSDAAYLSVWAPPDLIKRYGVQLKQEDHYELDHLLSPQEAKQMLAQVQNVFAHGESIRDTYFVQLPNGGFWQDTTLSPVWDQKGMVTAVVGFIRDITDLKRVERQLTTTKDRSLLYLDVMSHDIRNQLQVILGSTTLLLERADDVITTRLLEEAVEAAQKCARLILKVKTTEDLLSAPLAVQSLHDAVQKCIIAIRESHPDVRIHSELLTSEAPVRSDEFLEHLIWNVVENAFEHNPNDLKDIWIALRENDDGYEVSVADNGVGIPDKVKVTLFDMNRRFGGVGLHQSRQIVDKYGGRIRVLDRVQGDPHQGAEFRIWLPKALIIPQDQTY